MWIPVMKSGSNVCNNYGVSDLLSTPMVLMGNEIGSVDTGVIAAFRSLTPNVACFRYTFRQA
jgi:hypothetical protein